MKSPGRSGANAPSDQGESRTPDEAAPGADVGSSDFNERTVETDTRAFSALGNDTRYRIARLLDSADNELCVCHIEPILSVNQSTISRALRELYEAGLVTRRKDGRWRYYSVTPLAERLIEVMDTARGG